MRTALPNPSERGDDLACRNQRGIQNLSVSRQRNSCAEGYCLRRGGGRVCQHRGAVRLRQIHAFIHHCGAGRAQRRRDPRGRRDAARGQPQDRLHAAKGSAVSLAQHLGQRNAGAGAAAAKGRRASAARKGAAGALRSGAVCPARARGSYPAACASAAR